MICCRCNIETDDFYRGQKCCKACSKAKNAASIAKDPERRKANGLRHYYKKKDTYKVKSKIYREKNRQVLRQKFKDYWWSNLEKVRADHVVSQQRRRERKRKLDSSYSKTDRMLTFELFNNQCFKCKVTTSLEIDHHYPLYHGYALSLGNAVVLCSSCNPAKGKKMPEEFYSSEELDQLKAIFAKLVRC